MENVIYAAVFPNSKRYVGQAGNFKNRKREHKRCSLKNTSLRFYKAVRKYGWDNIRWEILEFCTGGMLNEREEFWVADQNSFIPNGYNMTPGGTGGDLSSFHPDKESTSLKKSEASRAYWANPDNRKKQSFKLKQYHAQNPDKHNMKNPEVRSKVTKTQRSAAGRLTTSDSQRKSYENNPERRQKLSKSMLGNRNGNGNNARSKYPKPQRERAKLTRSLFDGDFK